jgi:excisionase family DNA binding protein
VSDFEWSQSFMTVAEATDTYRVSQATIYKLMREGRLTRHRRGGDRHNYLEIAELDRELGRPRPKPRE